jgi:hypothetical protein
MAASEKAVWLKVLIGFIFTLILVIFTAGSAMVNSKVSKEVFNQHKEHQTEQFGYIKDSLKRIEAKQ